MGIVFSALCRLHGSEQVLKSLFHTSWTLAELDMEAWSFRKYINLGGPELEINRANGANVPWLRLADIYFLYAETLTHTGDNATALEYINKVKRRAYGYPVNGTSTVDYKSLTDVTKAPDAVLKNDPLKYERWAEFFGEGQLVV